MQYRYKFNPPAYLLACLVLTFALRVLLPVYAFIEPPQAFAGLVAVLFGILASATSSGLFVDEYPSSDAAKQTIHAYDCLGKKIV